MKSDWEHSGRTPRRSPSAPVPGMPYRVHTEPENTQPTPRRRDLEFIESMPPAGEGGPVEGAYNPWEEMGWQGGETPFPVTKEPEVLQEERYFKPMLDLSRKMPELYNAYDGSDEPGSYSSEEPGVEPVVGGTEFFEEPPPVAPVPVREKKRFEPLRLAVILSCVAWVLFCTIEVYRIASDVIQSETQLREYRAVYLSENNEDFSRNAHAVALRPAGETYPPTASPVPVTTPTPTPRIAQNDPLIAAMAGGVDPNASVAPETETPAPRYRLDRYPFDPLLIVSGEVETLRLTNPDAIGRLIIDGLLDETVVMRNNTYYLNHNAAGAYSGYGAIFADENTVFRYPPENILLYGRTSNEGKTFAPLKGYVDQGVEFAKQHAFVTLNHLYEDARYVIFAVIRASSDPASADYFDAQKLSFATDEEMLAYVQSAVSRSLYGFSVGVQASDRLLTLVTISDGADSSRIILLCRMLREGEAGYVAGATPAP